MIGQERLQSQMRKLIRGNALPNFFLLWGDSGQGKRTLAKLIAEQLKAELYIPADLKVDAVRAIIKDSVTLSKKRVYLLGNAKGMTRQAQNAILKLAEEPPNNAYIILTIEQKEDVLPTILSRASTFELDRYTKEEISQSTDNPFLQRLCSNPGQVEYFLSVGYEALIVLSTKVIDNIGKISGANTFNILKTVKPEEYEAFVMILIHELGVRLQECKTGADCMVYARIIDTVFRFGSQLENKSVNKQNALEMMLIEARGVASWTSTS